ncbi:vasoactive intestinal polypeptide receptor 2 isoform X5 [Lemur catta]|uniref:vasoactive intestinal polypeptide receptor 2 isoform X5 n=1 Tax=Lemur catta TaxID=9447 RepID=UPI001E26C89E|nr:vasoactive intestinal polypeptide receptor 2 isoform X5 [Lemur catta]
MRARALLPPALLTCWLLAPVNSIHPECRFHLEIQEEEAKCAELLRSQAEKHRACGGVWDNLTCWRPADVGETVTVPCPKVFSNFYSKAGNISKNCTSDGWSAMFPDFVDACGYSDPEDESKEAALHQELHPPEPVPVLHAESCLRAGQGRRALLQLRHPALPGPAVLLVLHHGQLLLAAGGGAVPAHAAGGHVLPRQMLPGLPPPRMGHPHRLRGGVGRGPAPSGRHGLLGYERAQGSLVGYTDTDSNFHYRELCPFHQYYKNFTAEANVPGRRWQRPVAVQEAGQVDAPAHPAVRHPLRGVRRVPGQRHPVPDPVRAVPRLLPGTCAQRRPRAGRAASDGAFSPAGPGGGRALLLPERRGAVRAEAEVARPLPGAARGPGLPDLQHVRLPPRLGGRPAAPPGLPGPVLPADGDLGHLGPARTQPETQGALWPDVCFLV